MKVKIKGVYFDTSEEPIMLILDKSEIQNIASLKQNKICIYPEETSVTDVLDFMEEDNITVNRNREE